MADTLRNVGFAPPGAIVGANNPPQIPLAPVGMSLGVFLAVTYVLCVGFDLLFPGHAMYESWQRLLPGFTWLTWPSFFLGLVESFAYGWYAALILVPSFNFFARRAG